MKNVLKRINLAIEKNGQHLSDVMLHTQFLQNVYTKMNKNDY